MVKNRKSLLLSSIMLAITAAYGVSAHAAIALDLSQKQVSTLKSFGPSVAADSQQLKETSRGIDFNKTLHVRFQETFRGYPVFGGEAILHIPHGAQSGKVLPQLLANAEKNGGSLDGMLYTQLDKDLLNAPAYIFNAQQAEKAVNQAIMHYQQKTGEKVATKDQTSRMIVFIDDQNKAHFAFQVSFFAQVKPGMVPSKPVYILDATTFDVYADWNDIKTVKVKMEDTFGGGYGGNKKMGKLVYDGLANNYAKLDIKRDTDSATCYLQNNEVTVKKCLSSDFWGQCRKSVDFSLACAKPDAEHNNVYWNGEIDAVNGGYSPSNDALFNGAIIKAMYEKWYNMQVLEENGKPMMLKMIVHLPMDNAYWDGSTMNFGDGVRMFYPLTSLGVAGHEISHGFTEQHSDLTYRAQSGGMNESFSDMAAQAAEVYAYGKNTWQIGPEIFKQDDRALRYMDKPSKDCNGKKPGSSCSIDSASQYRSNLDVHYTSGVYNRLFYLLATTKGWDVKKTFAVMLQANAHYWTSSTDFARGACGLLKATKDFGYSQDDVKAALKGVDITVGRC